MTPWDRSSDLVSFFFQSLCRIQFNKLYKIMKLIKAAQATMLEFFLRKMVHIVIIIRCKSNLQQKVFSSQLKLRLAYYDQWQAVPKAVGLSANYQASCCLLILLWLWFYQSSFWQNFIQPPSVSSSCNLGKTHTFKGWNCQFFSMIHSKGRSQDQP